MGFSLLYVTSLIFIIMPEYIKNVLAYDFLMPVLSLTLLQLLSFVPVLLFFIMYFYMMIKSLAVVFKHLKASIKQATTAKSGLMLKVNSLETKLDRMYTQYEELFKAKGTMAETKEHDTTNLEDTTKSDNPTKLEMETEALESKPAHMFPLREVPIVSPEHDIVNVMCHKKFAQADIDSFKKKL